jgi:hypothetical protein
MGEVMDFTVQVSPAILMRWLPSEALDRSIVLLDFEADVLKPSCLHLDINVVLNYVALRRRVIGASVDYYVGCTGVRVEVEAASGEIADHSSSQTLNVNYQNAVSRKRTSSIKIAPKVTIKADQAANSLELGEVLLEAGHDSTFTASYAGLERLLTATHFGRAIRWEAAMPRGEKVIGDFLSGNLYLFADCCWRIPLKRGRVSVTPTEVRFFNSERRPVGKMASLVMEYILWQRGIKLMNTNGICTDFVLSTQE